MTAPVVAQDRGDPVPSGLIVVDKPSGWTSHQVVGRIRRLLGTRRVGHAGTLDPMATGVLLVGVERATRLLGHLALADKTYDATIRLGADTLTDDAEGEILSAPGAAGIEEASLNEALAALRGPIQQVPSAVSAIKVGGVRSYARVRSGDAVPLAARPVVVRRLHVVSRRDVDDFVDLDVVVECTTGTYVRALARDLGASLGTGGHLTALRRTRVGPYGLDRARPLDEPVVQPMAEVAAENFPALTVGAEQSESVRHGRRLPGLALPGDPTALFDAAGAFLALYAPVGPDAVAVAVFTG